MSLHENKAVVQRLFDAINTARLDELPQVVATELRGTADRRGMQTQLGILPDLG